MTILTKQTHGGGRQLFWKINSSALVCRAWCFFRVFMDFTALWPSLFNMGWHLSIYSQGCLEQPTSWIFYGHNKHILQCMPEWGTNLLFFFFPDYLLFILGENDLGCLLKCRFLHSTFSDLPKTWTLKANPKYLHFNKHLRWSLS